MATPQKGCVTRLQKELRSLMKDPVPHIQALPSPTNLLEWHFVLEGAPKTEFEGGVYHGKLVFPPNYPFKPPSISIFTPNGRFATNTKLCLSITDYHPESWNPMWSVGTILTGLLSFMYDNQPTTGSITSSAAEKQQLATASLAFNVKSSTFRKLFPQWVEEQSRREQQQQKGSALSPERSAATGHTNPAQQQQQQQAPPGQLAAPAQAAAAGRGTGGAAPAAQSSGLFTVALLVLVIALAAVPLLHTGGGPSMTGLADRLGRHG